VGIFPTAHTKRAIKAEKANDKQEATGAVERDRK